MKAKARRVGLLALVATLLLVPGVKALNDCSSYISSGSGEDPLTGELIGQRTVTTSRQTTFSGTLRNPTLSGSYTYQRSYTTSYSVGIYRMSDGSVKEVRCDTYTLA